MSALYEFIAFVCVGLFLICLTALSIPMLLNDMALAYAMLGVAALLADTVFKPWSSRIARVF